MAESPGAARIFLLTDIEGSTGLWERHPETMRSALSRHDGILQALITHQRGRIVKFAGDGVLAWFDRPRQALEAALAIQHVVGSASWGDLGSMRVRVGLHAGEAQHRDQDFFGQTINRLARLLAVIRGGQIIASEAVVHVLDGDVPASVHLHSLGAIELRDVLEPIQAFLVELSDPSGASAGPVAERLASALVSPVSSSPSVASDPDRDRPAPTASPDLTIRVYTLGEFRVEQGDRVIPANGWGGSKARQLFKYLITRRTRRLPRDDVYETFFADSGDAAAATLRTTILRLREILQPDVDYRQSVVQLPRDVVAIRPDADVWVDADEFERLCREANRSDDPLALLGQANQLYRGDYLPDDPYDEWASNRREALRQVWNELQHDLARLREQHGDVQGAAAALQTLLASDGCDEQAARELMLLRARHSESGEALRVFQRLADALRRHLDLEPSPETATVRDQIAAGEVAPTRPGSPAAPPVTSPTPDRARPAPDPTPDPPPVALPTPAPPPPPPFHPAYRFPMPDLLVGRQREMLLLRRLLERGRAGGHVVLIGAAAGSGKSTVAGATVDHARSRGFLTLAGGSYDREGTVPFGPIRDALTDYLLTRPAGELGESLGAIVRDLAHVVPELRAHLDLPDRPGDETMDAGRLFGAVHACLRRLAARQPVVLCLEDLHAADGATLGSLHSLARQLSRAPITVIGTYRTEELHPGEAPARTLAAMVREGMAQQITLATLGKQETADLVTSLLDGPPSDDLGAALYETSEGNPLFVEQLVLSLQEDGRVQQRGGVWYDVGDGGTRLPPMIREVIERRFARLSPRCREVLEVAAVIGQTFDLRVLIDSQRERDDEMVIRDLDEAIRAQVVEEVAGGFAFGHALLREALYRGMSGPLRALVHARAGAAIEGVAASQVAELAAELAHHFRLAVEVAPTAAKAIGYSLEAGRRAVALSAHREALLHFTRACDLIERQSDVLGDAAQLAVARIEALDGRAWAERQLGMWLACITSCQMLLELSDDHLRRANIRSMVCRALRSLGDTQRSMAEAEAGLAELTTAEETAEVARARIRLLYDRAFLCHLAGRFLQVETVGREMLTIAERHELTANECLPYATVALACMHQGRDAEAVEYYGLAIAAAEATRDLVFQAVFHENLGKQHHQAGRFDLAEPELARGVELYESASAGPRSVNAIHWLARVELSRGNLDAAQTQAERALSRAVDGQDRWAAECYDVLGAIDLVRSSWEVAEASYERALSIRERVAHADGIVESLVGLATIAERCGDWTRAEQLALRAREIARSIDPCPDQARPERLLGRLYSRKGEEQRAAACLEAALLLVEPRAPTVELVPTLLAYAEHCRRRNDVAAGDVVERALGAVGPAEPSVELRVFAAGLLCERGAFDGAHEHVEAARRLAQRTGSPRLLGLAELAAARLLAARGAIGPAQDAFEGAIRLLEGVSIPYEHAVATREYGCVLLGVRGREDRGRALLASARLCFTMLGAVPDAAACDRTLGERVQIRHPAARTQASPDPE